jgi:hypothetical protein
MFRNYINGIFRDERKGTKVLEVAKEANFAKLMAVH